ncbi:hypothetical protein BKA70DRAFT_1490736 [Coprinopsis sp. MPI-PUGE-AT-0042]|nr:hypothetical protein BKA70DRAFT_1490736 [Coprinopsis sp. MPI-PUGE-AT-0042]
MQFLSQYRSFCVWSHDPENLLPSHHLKAHPHSSLSASVPSQSGASGTKRIYLLRKDCSIHGPWSCVLYGYQLTRPHSTSQMVNSWLKWPIFVSLWLRVVSASEYNVTVDDADPSLLYYPADAWYANGDPYPVSAPLDIWEARLSSYHIPHSRLRRSSSNGKRSRSSQRTTTTSSTSIHQPDGDASDPIDLQETSYPWLTLVREGLGREFGQGAEASIRFEFVAGSAIYIYGLSHSTAGQRSPSHNISVSIDGVPHAGTTTSSTIPGPNVMIFAQRGLIDAQTSFFLDKKPSATTDPSASIATASAPPSSSAQPNKQRNITTFAGAVGGSVGVLALLSLGLAISIIRRRRLAAKRERLEREDPEHLLRQQQQRGMAQTGSNDVVFIPRYFPGTEIPPSSSPLPPGDLPPPYSPPVAPPTAANHHNVSTRGTGRNTLSNVQNPAFTYALPPFHPPMRSPYLHHPPPRPSDSPELSYADIPPDSPPPPPPSELLPLNGHPPSAPPRLPVAQPQRPTHVNVAVGNDHEQDED